MATSPRRSNVAPQRLGHSYVLRLDGTSPIEAFRNMMTRSAVALSDACAGRPPRRTFAMHVPFAPAGWPRRAHLFLARRGGAVRSRGLTDYPAMRPAS